MLIEVKVKGLPVATYTLPRSTNDTVTEVLLDTRIIVESENIRIVNEAGELEYRFGDRVLWSTPAFTRLPVEGKLFTLGNALVRMKPFMRQSFYYGDRLLLEVDRYTVNRFGEVDGWSLVVGNAHIFLIDTENSKIVKTFPRDKRACVNIENM